MTYRTMITPLLLLGLAAAPAAAQERPILGTWEADAEAEVPFVIIRADSSASYGEETVRWRLRDDKIMIALGGEWICYKLEVKSSSITLSEGDLTEPITLRKVGPPSARPDSIPLPADPEPGTAGVCAPI